MAASSVLGQRSALISLLLHGRQKMRSLMPPFIKTNLPWGTHVHDIIDKSPLCKFYCIEHQGFTIQEDRIWAEHIHSVPNNHLLFNDLIVSLNLILNPVEHSSLDFPGKYIGFVCLFLIFFVEWGILLCAQHVFNNLSAPKSGPRNLQVYNATSNSLTVKWDPASGRVQKYRITHQPSTGEGNEQTVICSVKWVCSARCVSAISLKRLQYLPC